MCRGHLLIEDVPGTGKTVLAKAIARSLGCSFRRIQFTPDLLPSDVTGLSIYNQKTREFEFRQGPVFANVVLVDEVNRAMPRSLLEPVLHQKGNHDFGSANLCQQIALEAMRDGSYGKHLELLKTEYRKKRDFMLASLSRHMPKGIHWTHPHGGLYIWLTLPASIDTSRSSRMFLESLNHHVLYVPGDYCFQPDESGQIPRNHLRLSFGQVAIENIDDGIQRLASVIQTLTPNAHRQSPAVAEARR